MRNYLNFLLIAFLTAKGFSAVQSQEAQLFGADDLHLRGRVMSSYQIASGEHILAFTEGLELSIGDNHIKSNKAIIWLNSQTTEYQGVTKIVYRAKAYLEGDVAIDEGSGSKTSGLEITESIVKGVESMVAEFTVSGEVFATAENKIAQDVRETELYRNALVATGQVKAAPVEKPAAAQETQEEEKPAAAQEANKPAAEKTKQPGIFGGIFGKGAKQETKQAKAAKQVQQAKQAQPAPQPEAPAPKFQYPVNISGLGTEPVKITNENLPDGTNLATVLNRFYLWQKQDEDGRLLEFQADNAVIFYSRSTVSSPNGVDGLLAGNTVKAIYLRGNIVMTEGLRTMRANEAYYDFQTKQGLVVNAVMRNYDPSRGIPIYIRADKLRQVSENKFAGKNVTLTNSEFYVPRTSMTASEMVVTDTTTIDEQAGKIGDHSYNVMMKNVKLKLDNRTVFWWPKIETNLQRSDTPIKKAHIGYDKTFGTSVETEWYLTRVLGIREPEGVDSSLLLDYFSKRGVGLGTDIRYKRNDYFGNINAYVINDRGEDDLGRDRQDLQPAKTLRGRFKFQHRQFLPYDWQLTLETSYLSDENYLESFHRGEFLTDKEQETLIHLKRIKDNWAFAIMGKWRINDFQDQLEELPSAQYHLKGQSLFDDKVVLYHDSTIGRYRQRIGDNHSLPIVSGEDFTFASTRTELDMPLKASSGSTNIVPYVAGTFGYDDRSGFARDLVTGTGTDFGSQDVFIGEVGARASTQYHKTFNDVRSKFWDINGIRHIVKPYVNAAIFAESTDTVQQRDKFNVGVLQRWQTKRGTGSKERTVEWMRLNTDFTWVGGDSSAPVRPDKFLWNNSIVPLSALSAPHISNGDLGSPLRTFETFGMQRDSFNADYIWRMSDTTALLSDLNYDVENRQVEQFDIGFSRMRWPDLSYYVGTRYLKNIEVGDDKENSNAFTFAVTYKINPRYTITLATQYDFGLKQKIGSQVTLIRRYHRLYYGLTFSMDESLDRQAIVLSIWPEGASELSIGSRRFMGLDSPQDRND
jgi:hypothetical protein